jgi:4-carboxymuconolactone decarboxylase
MPRIPELDVDGFSPEQRKVYDAVMSGPRGRIVGPLKVWLHSAGLAEHAQALGAYCRYNSVLPPRLSELAIITTGAFWKAHYEWFAHAPLAIKAGIDPVAVEAIRTGKTPNFTKTDEQIVYELTHELLTTRRIAPTTFERANKELGHKAVIDLVGIIGYYGLVSVTLNAFEIPLPEGEKLPFDV